MTLPTLPPSLLPIVLVLHITLAISLFVPSLVLPFVFRPTRLRRGREEVGPPGRAVRFLLRLQSSGSLIVGAGLAATGFAMLSVLGIELLSRPWLLTALALYAATMVVSFAIQRPAIRTILRRAPLDPSEEERMAARARRARYVSYAMGGAVGLIGVLMSSKPVLW